MDETQPYEAILETYKKQETVREEQHEQLNKYLSEYQDAIKKLENTKKCVEDELINLNQKELKLIENTQYVLGVTEENNLTWKVIKEKQSKLCESRTKMHHTLEDKKDILQEASKDLRQLDMEHESENISTKIEDFRGKTKNLNEIVGERCAQYQHLNFVARADYQIPSNVREQFPKQSSTKSLHQLNEEIKKSKKNIHTIDLKTKELEQQL